MRTEQEIKRLEELSGLVRMGEPIDFGDALDVIDYQTELAANRAKNVSLFGRIKQGIVDWCDTIRGVR